MPVDPRKDAHLLAVHGVQLGSSTDIVSAEQVRSLVDSALDRSHLARDFEVEAYLYEDVNDEAQQFYQVVGSALTSGNPVARAALGSVIDIVGDVVSAAADTSTARKIRDGLRGKILELHEAGHQLVVVSHSLGTVYALDVICELIQGAALFKGDDVATWPIRGLITMGSPLGLDIDLPAGKIFTKRTIPPIENAEYTVFPWHNFFNRLDPVVSGAVFGSPVAVRRGNGPVERRYGGDTQAASWRLQGHAVTSGKQWLLAHTAYWKSARIGDRIVDMLWG